MGNKREKAIAGLSKGRLRRYSTQKLQALVILALTFAILGPKCAIGNDNPKTDSKSRLSQYIQRSWSMADGFPSNHVRDIAQTQDGYIWFATSAGLVRFDGLQPIVFNLVTTPVMQSEDFKAVVVGSDQSVWIGSLGGGGLIRYKDGQFSHYVVGNGTESVSALVFDVSGKLWIGTDSGLFSRENGRIARVSNPPPQLADAHVRSLFLDHLGALWVGTRGAGVFSYHNGRYESYTTAKDGLSSNHVEAVVRDRDNVLWVGTNAGLERMDSQGRFSRFLLTPDTPQDRTIWRLMLDRNSRVWVGSNRGLGRIDSGQVQFLDKTTGSLQDIRIRSLFEDRDDGIWVGFYGGGASRLQDGPIRTIARAEGVAEEYVSSINGDSNDVIWLTTTSGFVQTVDETGAKTVLELWPGPDQHQLRSISVDAEQTVWLGTDQGLMRYTGGELTRLSTKDGLPSNQLRVVYADPANLGTLWIGTMDKGACRYRDDTFTCYDVTNGLSDNNVRWILRSRQGVLWIGTEVGINRFDDDGITTFTSADGLLTNAMRCGFEEDDGTLWFGTRAGGLARYRDGSFRVFTTRDGLAYNSAWSVLDDQEHLWLSSDRGIQRIPKADLEERANGSSDLVNVRLFGTSAGMKSNECNGAGFPTGARSGNGHLWFPTMDGAVRVDPRSPQLDLNPPPTIIESLRVASNFVAITPEIVLPAGHNDLEIQYTAFAYSEPLGVSFRYRLEGHDREWIDAGRRRTAYYTNLSPGWYSFHVSATNDTRRDGEVASLSFRIEPQLYQSWWFLPLAGSIVVSTVTWMVMLLLNRQKMKTTIAEAELNKARQALVRRTRFMTIGHLAANIAHELKNPLGAVRNSAFFLKRLLSSGDQKVIEHLKIIDRETGVAVKTIDEILAMARDSAPVKCSVELADVARDVFSRVSLDSDALKLELALDDDSMSIFVDPGQFNQVLINLMTNSIQAVGSSGRIRISACSTIDSDIIRFSDDGPGISFELEEQIFEPLFTTKAKGSGLGLALSRQILERHEGSIALEDQKDEDMTGASFVIRLPRQLS